MKTMRQALALCSKEQLTHIDRLWSLEGMDSKEIVGTHQEKLAFVMQDTSAARLLWEQLTDDERRMLYEVLLPSARYGIESSALQQKLLMPAERFDVALKSLVYSLLIQANDVTSRANTAKKSKPVNMVLLAAFSENVKTLYEVGQEFFAVDKDRSRMPLSQFLTTVSDSELLVMMQSYKLYANYMRSRTEDRVKLAETLLEREDPLEGLTGLSKKARETFKWLCEQKGRASFQQVREYTGLEHGKLLVLLRDLAHFALAFDAFSEKAYVLFVPREIYLNMVNVKEVVGEEKKAELIPLETPPAVIRAEEPLILYDIMMLLNAVYQQNIEPTQQGRVPKRLAAKLRPLLRGYKRGVDDASDGYVDTLLTTMLRGEIIALTTPVASYEKAHYVPGDGLEEWAGLSMEDQTRLILANAWLVRPSLTDVVLVDTGMAGDEDMRNAVYGMNIKDGRTTVLKYLSRCVPGRWYAMDTLLDVIWDESPFALRTVPPPVRRAERHKGSVLYKRWRKLDGVVFAGMISSSLYDMGMVELGYDQVDTSTTDVYQRPAYFMLTAKGARVITWVKKKIAPLADLTILYDVEDEDESAGDNGHEVEREMNIIMHTEGEDEDDEDEDEYDEDDLFGDEDEEDAPRFSYAITPSDQERVPPRVLVVQPNYELLVMQPDFPTIYRLLPFAQAQQVGLVSRLMITRASIINGRKSGMSNEDILRVLEEHSQRDLPQNVVYTIQDWTKGYKSALVSQALLLDVSSEEVAQSLLESPEFVKFGLRKLGPTTLAVTKNMSVQELKRELTSSGIVASLNGNITIPDPHTYGSSYGKRTSYGPVTRRTTYGRY